MAPRRRGSKGKARAGTSTSSLSFLDEFSPQQGFDVGYWDRDPQEVVNTNVNYGDMGQWSWRRIYALTDPCREYMPSKYCDPATLDYFNIRDEIHELMERIGWTLLLTVAYYTSSAMLLDFYSCLKITKEERARERIYTRVEFVLGGFSFDYTVEEFAMLFWFDPADPSMEKGLIRSLGMSKVEF